MVDVKAAVQAALEYFNDLYGHQNFRDILVEEVEAPVGQPHWQITIGFLRTVGVTGTHYERHYKTFQVDGASGQVSAMKIRVP